jgi:hypothetical protein
MGEGERGCVVSLSWQMRFTSEVEMLFLLRNVASRWWGQLSVTAAVGRVVALGRALVAISPQGSAPVKESGHRRCRCRAAAQVHWWQDREWVARIGCRGRARPHRLVCPCYSAMTCATLSADVSDLPGPPRSRTHQQRRRASPVPGGQSAQDQSVHTRGQGYKRW